MASSKQQPSSTVQRPRILGLIGGMGAGKSSLAAEFARRGARVLAGDQFGHEALVQPNIRAAVLERWGMDVLTAEGEIDRRQLGKVVFADPIERRALEALSFPWIRRRFREEIDRATLAGTPLVVVDAALLLEAGWNALCDRIVYIHAPRALRLHRLAEQRGWTEQEMAAREAAQLSLTEKASRADVAIDNSGLPEVLGRQLDRVLTAPSLSGRSSPVPLVINPRANGTLLPAPSDRSTDRAPTEPM